MISLKLSPPYPYFFIFMHFLLQYAVMAFLINFAREMVKTIENYEGDPAQNHFIFFTHMWFTAMIQKKSLHQNNHNKLIKSNLNYTI